MLDADYLFNVADDIVELYEQLNIFGINDICRRLVNTDFQLTGSADWQYYILQQTGMSRAEINKQIAQITKKSEAAIKEIFEEASYLSHNADMSVYEKAGITALPFSQSERMLRILDATYRATLGELHNLTMTTADVSQQLLINTLNETQWKVATGMQSKNQAVADAIEKVSADGIDVMYGSGVMRSIESVVRICVTTGINQACAQISLQNCESMGTDLVLTSSHPGARTGDGYKGHVNWQGRVFSLSGNSKKYPSFKEECGYGLKQGICGINCRHSFFPYIDGVSQNQFERYDSEKDKAKYANQQKQRKMERDIRTTKRQLQGMQESMNATGETDVRDVLQEKYDRLAYKLRTQKEKYNMFCADNKLVPQTERMKVAGFKRAQASKASGRARAYEHWKNSTELGKLASKSNNILEYGYKGNARFSSGQTMTQYMEDLQNALNASNGNQTMASNIKAMMGYEWHADKNVESFMYDPINDKLLYNPDVNLEDFNMNAVLVHEMAHKLDVQVYKSWENKGFIEAINKTKDYILQNKSVFENALAQGGQYYANVELNDIISAITRGEISTWYSHEASYWNDITVAAEIFANLTSVDLLHLNGVMETDGFLNLIYDSYLQIVEG